MKRKMFFASGIVLVFLAITAVMVYAFTYGNVDGVWGQIDSVTGDGLENGASCDRWASGPSAAENPNSATGLDARDDWWNQTGPTTDWNQVRYGEGWGCLDFDEQSGMAFNGVDAVTPVPIPYSQSESFLMGKFCHINNPILASNNLNTVPLTITMGTLSCGVGYSVDRPNLAFNFNVTLDETTNSGTCTYPSTTPCADAVSAPQPTDATFRCTNVDHPEIYADYTIATLGFIPLANSDASCTGVVYNPVNSRGIFISNEGTTNCGCLFGMITDEVPTAVKLSSFTADASGKDVAVAWETASEIDNLGFNLYRAESLDGVRIKLNATLIRSDVAPGSTFGANYIFTDNTVKPYRSYFYWLEDVDAYGVSTFHGPVGVSVQ